MLPLDTTPLCHKFMSPKGPSDIHFAAEAIQMEEDFCPVFEQKNLGLAMPPGGFKPTLTAYQANLLIIPLVYLS